VDEAALQDGHPGLRDCPDAVNDRLAGAGEVQDVDAGGEALLARRDEVVARSLKPGRHHVAVVVPLLAEQVPVRRVPRDHPVLDDFPDGELVGQRLVARMPESYRR
jgi:hypothetical protein